MESIDEFGVWCVSRIEEVTETHVCVSFPEWPRDFDRKIVDGEEIRHKTSLPPGDRKRGYVDTLNVMPKNIKIIPLLITCNSNRIEEKSHMVHAT